MKQPAISVLIPVYNAEKYLEDCLQSVANQTFKDFEIICLNDGSTDGSAEILKRWQQKEPRLKVFCQKNAGLSVVRNEEIKRAQGKYVATIDADDLLAPQFLEKLYQKAEDEKADVTRCYFDEMSEDGKSLLPAHCIRAFYKDSDDKLSSRFVCGYADASSWNKLFRLQFIRDNHLSFYPGRAGQDLPFTIVSFLLAKKIVQVKEKLYFYRKGMAGAVTSNRLRTTTDHCKNAIDLLHELKRRDLLKDVRGNWVKLAVWNIARFHKLTRQEQVRCMNLQQQVWQHAREETIHLHGLQRYRWELLFRLVDIFGWRSVYFWSRIFR